MWDTKKYLVVSSKIIFKSVLYVLTSTIFISYSSYADSDVYKSKKEPRRLFVLGGTKYDAVITKNDSTIKEILIINSTPNDRGIHDVDILNVNCSQKSMKYITTFLFDENQQKALIKDRNIKSSNWFKPSNKTFKNIYVQFACENYAAKTPKLYKSLNQCFKKEIVSCGTDTDCLNKSAICWRYLPKSCYFGPYGVNCDPVSTSPLLRHI